MPADPSNMLKVIEDFPLQCRTALELPKGMTVSGKVDKIVVCGMGGSAVGGDLLKIYMHDSKVPVFVVRDYKVPNFVDENTLVFAVSYSGNTEETSSAVEERIAKKIGLRTPIIYASEMLNAVAYRWKTQFNENSKAAAFHHSFSEMNHNEIAGYRSMNKSDFAAIFIRDK